MVRIPTYQQRLTPEGGTTPLARPGQLTDAPGQALEAVGRGLGQVADVQMAKLREKEDADAVAEATRVVADETMWWDTFLSDSLQNRESLDGFGGEIVQEFDQRKAYTLGNVKNPKARAIVERQLEQLRITNFRRAVDMEARAGAARRDQSFTETVDTYAWLIAKDPAQFEEARTNVLEAVANLGYDPITRAERARGALETLSGAVLMGAVERDPGAVKATLEGAIGVTSPDVEAARAALPVSVGALWPHVERQESGGRQSAVSSKNATGVAQIMPGTGPEAAKLAGLPWDPERFKKDAAYNRALGQAYLGHLLKRYDGDPRKALAAYNWGQGNVAKSIAKHGDAWLEHAPKETRDYVAAITARAGLAAAPAEAADPVLARAAADLPLAKLPGVLSAAQAEMNRRMSAERARIAQVEGDHMTAFAQGNAVQQPLTQADYLRAFGAEDGPRRWEAYAGAQQLGADLGMVRTMPEAQLVELEKSYKPDPNAPGYEAAAKRQAILLQAIQQTREARAEDPVGFAQVAKIGNAAPLDFENADAFVANLSTRKGLAEAMTTLYGAPYKLLSDKERTQLTAGLQRQSPEKKMVTLNRVRTALPDDRAFLSLMAEIAPDSPVTAAAGAMSVLQKPAATTGMFGWVKDAPYVPQDVAALLLEGEALLNPTKATKAEDGKGTVLPMPPDKEMRATFNEQLGAAFAGSPRMASDTYQAVRAYYAAKAARAGDLSGELNPDRLDEAIEAVTGGTSEVGNGVTLRPWGMSEDRFQQAVRDEFGRKVKSSAYPDAVLDRFRLEIAGPGQYVLVSGTGYLLDKQGQPVVLELGGTR